MYLFTEDDMPICDNGVIALQYAVSKAGRRFPEGFVSMRVSYGMNGVVISDEDVEVFAKYLEVNQVRRPPDHLIVEWFAGETEDSRRAKRGRPHASFRYNIMSHIGSRSTLRSEASKKFPSCYEELGEPTLFKVEAFDFEECDKDDVWPCEGKGNTRVDWGVGCVGDKCRKVKGFVKKK